MTLTDATYKQQIIERYQSPQHKGSLNKPTVQAEVSNALCGDRLHFQLAIDGEVVQDIAWQGEGCAICLAAADLLAHRLLGLTIDEVKAFSELDVFRMLGIELKPSREKCALLGLNCVQQALETQA